MDLQQVLNMAIGVLVASLGWALRELWTSHKDLASKHHDHTLHTAEKYVTKDDFKDQLDHIRNTCDNIWKAIRDTK